MIVGPACTHRGSRNFKLTINIASMAFVVVFGFVPFWDKFFKAECSARCIKCSATHLRDSHESIWISIQKGCLIV